MPTYYVFAGEKGYHPKGGVEDVIGASFPTLEDALLIRDERWDWGHIVTFDTCFEYHAIFVNSYVDETDFQNPTTVSAQWLTKETLHTLPVPYARGVIKEWAAKLGIALKPYPDRHWAVCRIFASSMPFHFGGEDGEEFDLSEMTSEASTIAQSLGAIDFKVYDHREIGYWGSSQEFYMQFLFETRAQADEAKGSLDQIDYIDFCSVKPRLLGGVIQTKFA